MKNNLLDAYLDGFEMAKQMFVDSKKLSGFMMFGWRVNLNTSHAIKMSEYAKHDLNIKESEDPLMSNEEINRRVSDIQSAMDDISKIIKKSEDIKNTIRNTTIDEFNNWLSDSTVETRSDEFKCVFKITHGGQVITGNDFLDMYDIFKSVSPSYIPR